ncbi:MAG: leucine-rich repeat protein, partial [Clostridia bacterium]
DMQLTGYSKTDNTVVFKSVAKNCKAFEVEGSLCVLENSLCDTPNVITEILNQLAYLTDIKNNLVQEFLASANAEFGALLCNYTWHTVNFWDRDILIASGCYLKGYKIHAPSPTLPADCRVEGGWYDVATNSLWDFAVNTVTKDTDLYYNYYSTGLVFQGAFVKTYTGNATAVYIPRYYGGALVKNISTSMTPLTTTTPFTLYITDQISSIGQFALTNCLSGVVVHKDNPFLETRFDCLINKQTLTLEKIFASTQATTYTPPACFTTKTNCLFKATCSKLVLPSGLRSLASKTVVECNNLTSIEVPSSVVTIGNLATMNCINMKKVFITSTFP